MRSLAILAALTLSGCAYYGPATRAAADRGEQVADETRTVAQWTLCRAITVGAWLRAYGDDPEKAAAWRVLCRETAEQTPAG